ncbi:hypothetical protein Tco_1142135, partial [Tanacetum coccineum]
QVFKDLPLEHDILSFIRDLRHTVDITYLTDVNVDYLHQPWRAFATVINKCLSGKETRMDKISKVAKPDKKKQPAKKPKAKGLAVLSEVALTEAEQLNEDEDEDNENDFDDLSDEGDDDNDGNNDDDDDANDDDKQEGDDTNDDDEETDSDITESDRIKIPILDQSTTEYYEEEEEKIDDEETMYGDEDDEVTKELYEDVNVNLGNEDTEITNADQGGADQQNVSQHKLLNLDNLSLVANEIASLMDNTTHHATTIPKITSSFTTTIPLPPPFFNPLPQQSTPTPTPTTSKATTSFPALPDFAFYAQALSSIPSIVDRYMDNKLGEAINKAIQAHNFDYREEAQAEKREYIELVDSTARTIIKEEVNTQLPQILPQAISDSSYEAAATLSEFELIKILIDKMERNKSYDIANHKKELYDALIKSYQIDKDLFDSYGEVISLKRSRDENERDKDRDPSAGSDRGMKRRKSSKDAESSRYSNSKEKKSLSTSKDTSQSQHKSSGKSAHAKEPSHTVEDLGMQQDQEFVTEDNDEQPTDKEVTKVDWFKKPERPPTPDPD